MLISPSWGTDSRRPSPAQNGAGRDGGTAASAKPLICTELQQVPAHTNPVRTFRTFVLLREGNCLAQGCRVKNEAEFEPGLKIPLPMLPVCLPERPLLDLLRVAICIHLLFFSKNLPLLYPKRKLHPLGHSLQRLKPPQSNQLALSHLLLRPLTLKSGREGAEGFPSQSGISQGEAENHQLRVPWGAD